MIESIVETGPEPIFRPLSYASNIYLQNCNKNSKEIQMEVVRSLYSKGSLISLVKYVNSEFKLLLSKYNRDQRIIVLGNVSRHMCFMHANASSN